MDGASAEASEAMAEAVKPAENGEMEADLRAGKVPNGDLTSTLLRSVTPRAPFEHYKALYDAELECDVTLTCADSQGCNSVDIFWMTQNLYPVMLGLLRHV